MGRQEWALETPTGFIDATPYTGGSLMQFCACPGPSEIATVNFAGNSHALLSKAKQSCMIFNTLTTVPKSHQLTMMYDENEKTTEKFFRERGLVRCDVGTKRFPTLRKQSAGKAPWASK